MHCPKLQQRLLSGPMSVHDFMEHVLYDSQEGYYAQRPVLGPLGDYVTAPQMTQVFGEVLGAWFIHQWQQRGQPTPVQFIELGPGLGTLMADMLRVFTQFPPFMEALHIHFVECSDFLKASQKETIHHSPVSWHTTMAQIPILREGMSFLVANEFFDALPIHQYVHMDGQKMTRQVSMNSDGHLYFLPRGSSIEEFCPLYGHIMAEIDKRLSPTKGAALIIDYGDFTHPPRKGDTLQAIHAHKKVHPLSHVGHADLTHQVDFYALQSHFSSNVQRTFMTQAQFLQQIGFLERTQILCKKADALTVKNLELAAVRLTSSAEMGSLFKVLSLAF